VILGQESSPSGRAVVAITRWAVVIFTISLRHLHDARTAALVKQWSEQVTRESINRPPVGEEKQVNISEKRSFR
jgi:hypothetical protein